MTITCLIPKSVPSNSVDVIACRRLTGQIEAHATALRSWAGILLTRLHSPKAFHEGTEAMLRDIATAMETEATIAAGLARKLGRGK